MGADRSIAFRILSSIFILLGVYLVIINIICWANSEQVAKVYASTLDGGTYNYWHNTSMNTYKGFRWFYEELSTFPGLAATLGTLNQLGKFVNPLGSTPNDLWSWVVYIGQILSAPIQLLVTVVVDVIRNLVWFVHFIWIFGAN